MSIPNSPSRLSRAFKRLSLKTSEAKLDSLPAVLEVSPGGEDANALNDIDSRRFSLSSLRPPARWSTYSSARSSRISRKAKELQVNSDSKIDIKLDCANDDGVYRPGDILRGQVMLDRLNMQGKVLRSVSIRAEGKAKTPRYEIRINNLDDELERVVRTRRWLFYSAQSKIYPQRKEDTQTLDDRSPKETLTLPFSFELPSKDTSAELPSSRNIVAHCTPNWQKPASLPPTCKIINNDEEGAKSRSDAAAKSSSTLKRLFQSSPRPNVCDISYSIIVEVQWQRNVLQSNKAIAKMDFIVHSVPPTTASVSANFEDLLRRRQRQRLHYQHFASSTRFALSEASNNCNATAGDATNDIANGQTNWRTGRPTYLSQSLSRELTASARRTEATSAASNREVAVFDSHRGPRGWYIERYTHRLSTEQDVQIEFSFPAVPCFFMDKDVPFEIKVKYPSFLSENLKLVASDIKLDLFRHINSNSIGGRLCLESRNNINISNDDSIIQISEVKCQDTSAAPTDEYSVLSESTINASSQTFTGKFRIQSGLDKIRDALDSSRSVILDAISQDKVALSTPADRVLLPSFSFRGLSVDYTIGIRLSLHQVKVDNDPDSTDALPVIEAVAETSFIQVQSRCSSYQSASEPQVDSRRSSGVSPPAPAQESLMSTLSEVDDATNLEQRHSDEVRDQVSPLHSIIESTASNALPFQVDIHSGNSQLRDETSHTFNADIKQSIAQNGHSISANSEQQPLESVEYIYDNSSFSTAARERSGTMASCFSARTLDGLPPPYASPNLYDSRRL